MFIDFIRLNVYNKIILKYWSVKNVDFMSVQETAKEWGISVRRIQKLCEENRIDGAIKFSRIWAIPKEAKKPIDARLKNKENTNENTNS